MAVILSKETLNKTSLFKFYTRRFKRIVPLYYATLIVIYTGSSTELGTGRTPLGTNFLLIHPDKKQVLTDLKWVLPFAGNIEPFFETNGYWDQVRLTATMAVFLFLGHLLPFLCPLLVTGSRNSVLLDCTLHNILLQSFGPQDTVLFLTFGF